jgi:photosystem II stability/assembly factor-like uncharacterized protein
MKPMATNLQLAIRRLMPGLLATAGLLAHAADTPSPGARADASHALVLRPAKNVAHAAKASLLASALADGRIVAAGEHGVVLLSDDDGKTWRQARSVPVDLTLTGLSFVDAKLGWAVGHGGVVLHTRDGGETWKLQHSDLQQDRPLFAVHFLDARCGVAVGLWSLVLTTADGGESWQHVAPGTPPGANKADLNLLGLFADKQGRVYATGERGMVLRSTDQGNSWQYLPTGYAGTFWTGTAPVPGVLLAAGLRGSIFRSTDDGATWARIESGSAASITALLSRGSEVLALGLDGLTLRSSDAGASFTNRPRPDRLALTAGVLTTGGDAVLFSRQGPAPKAPAAVHSPAVSK